MLYKEKESYNTHLKTYHSFCTDNLSASYAQWIVPCRILGISPAEYAKILQTEYNAKVIYLPKSKLLLRAWENQADMRRWKNYINKVARTKNYQI